MSPRILLTGASRGIGAALARRLAALDVQLLLLARDEGALADLCDLGEHVCALAVDLAEPETIEHVSAFVDEEWGGELEALIHNAAASTAGLPLTETPDDELLAGLAVGPVAGYRLLRALAPRMKEGARVIFTSTGAAYRGFANLSAYATAKFALRGLAESAALELAPRGISVSSVVLPTVRTFLSARVFPPEVLADAPAPEEVLDPFLFLLSDRGAGVSAAVSLHEPATADPLAAPLFHARPAPRSPFLPKNRTDLAREGVREPIAKVDLGEPPFSPSDDVTRAVSDWMAGEHTSDYPDARCSRLRYTLAERHGLSQDHFLCGPGSSTVLAWILDGLLQAGDEVVCAWPCFALWPWLVTGRGLELKLVEASVPYHDVDAVLAAVGPRTRLIYLDTPGNPVGSLLRARDLERLMKALPKHVFVVVDHAYRDFVTDDEAVDATSLDALWDPRVLTVRTLSKTHALAGWRVGYAAAHPSTVRALLGVVPPFALSAPAQVAAVAALGDEDHARVIREHFARERRHIQAQLDELGVGYHRGETSFVSVPWPHVSSVREAAAAIGVPVAPAPADDVLTFAMRSREENERVLDVIRRHHPSIRA